MQLAVFTMVPQFLLSGLFFPLYSMPWAVRWIGYLLPLTWFIKVARGVMVRGTPIDALWLPLLILTVMAAAVFITATLRFRRDLAPAGDGGGRRAGRGATTPRPRARPRRMRRRRSPEGRREPPLPSAGAATWGVQDLTVRYGRRTVLDGVTWRSRPAGSRPSSAATAPARRRSCGRSPASSGRPAAGCCGRTAGASATSPAPPACTTTSASTRTSRSSPRRTGSPESSATGASPSCSPAPASPAPATGSPAASPAACGRSSRSRWRCCTSRNCSCSTSPRRASTRSAGPTCGG